MKLRATSIQKGETIMPNAHFIKVQDNIRWSDIVQLTQMVKSKGCKPIPYNTIAEIVLSQNQFELLVDSIAQPNPNYLEYTTRSIPAKDGIWNCISIKRNSCSEEVLLYTAGRTFPLYLAVN